MPLLHRYRVGERSALLCTSTFSTPNLLGTFTGPLQPLILPHLRQENADLTSKHVRRRDVFKLQYQVQDRRAKRAPVRLLRQSCTWMRCCRVLPLQEWAVWWREVWHSAGLSYMEIRDHSSTTMTMPLPTKKITSGTNDPANIPTDASKNLNAHSTLNGGSQNARPSFKFKILPDNSALVYWSVEGWMFQFQFPQNRPCRRRRRASLRTCPRAFAE